METPTTLNKSLERATRAPDFRRGMTAALFRWRRRYAALVMDAIRSKHTRRENLTRELNELVDRRDKVLRFLDDLATATGDTQWQEAKRRTELAWADLETTTNRLSKKAKAS